MDTNWENCFHVIDRNKKAVKFPCNEDGLYVRGPDKPVDCRELSFNVEVEGFTQREVGRAKAARKFYHDLNAENVENMKTFIRSN